MSRVAVGTGLAAGPRTDPGVRHYRTGLLPWVLASKRTFGYGCITRARGSHRVSIRLETADEVVREPHDDHITACPVPPPPLDPEIQNVTTSLPVHPGAP